MPASAAFEPPEQLLQFHVKNFRVLVNLDDTRLIVQVKFVGGNLIHGVRKFGGTSGITFCTGGCP
jgi:hypothetical protein